MAQNSPSNVQRPLISACMIVKNEERVLGRCLDIVSRYCDEICVLDTGSTDGTVRIAKHYNARVEVYTACNDRSGRIINFAKARNKVIGMATASWILSIDADEVLGSVSPKQLRKIVQSTIAPGIRITLRSGSTRWAAVRLFRNLPAIRYESPIHEWVRLPGLPADNDSIEIRNLPDKSGKESAVERDIRLCTLGLRRNPNDARMLLYLGIGLRKSGQYKDAILRFRRYASLAQEYPPGLYTALHYISGCYLMMGRWRLAERFAKRALAVENKRAESYCIIGDAHAAQGNLLNAINAFNVALSCPAPPLNYPMFVDHAFYNTYPESRIRDCRAAESQND